MGRPIVLSKIIQAWPWRKLAVSQPGEVGGQPALVAAATVPPGPRAASQKGTGVTAAAQAAICAGVPVQARTCLARASYPAANVCPPILSMYGTWPTSPAP